MTKSELKIITDSVLRKIDLAINWFYRHGYIEDALEMENKRVEFLINNQ